MRRFQRVKNLESGTYMFVRIKWCIFLRGQGFARSSYSSRLSYGTSNVEFHGRIAFLRSAVFEDRLQRPSPCLMRPVRGRERVWGLSDTNEMCATFCICGGTLKHLFSTFRRSMECLEKKQKHGNGFSSFIGIIFNFSSGQFHFKAYAS